MIEEITSESFEEKVLKANRPTVVKIYTNSCPNCKVLTPIFETTANENSNNYHFYSLHAQENMNIAKRYKILGVPTLLFFSHGILVDKKTGTTSQQKIEKKLAPLLNYSKEIAIKNERKGYFKLPWK